MGWLSGGRRGGWWAFGPPLLVRFSRLPFFGKPFFLGNQLRGTVVFCLTRLFGLFLGFRYLYVFRIIRFNSSFGTVQLSSPPFPSSLSFPPFYL